MVRPRSRREEAPGPSGFLVVDKPAGWTSHDVVDAARGWLGTRRVGHLGTLDPLATGVLPLAVRDATKLIAFVADDRKAYTGTFRLGIETDTLDADGREQRRHEGPLPDEEALRAVLAKHEGTSEQLPPMFSAVKRGGVPLHRLARQGREVERTPRRVRIDRLELLAYVAPDAEVRVECSAGTYVRAIAADVGAALGCGAHLLQLRRTRSGPFDETQARTVEQLEAAARRGDAAAHLLPAAAWLALPLRRLVPEALRRVLHGGDVAERELGPAPGGPGLQPGARVAGLDAEGELVAVLELRADRRLHPLRVLRATD